MARAPLPLRAFGDGRVGPAPSGPQGRELVRARTGLRGVAGGGWPDSSWRLVPVWESWASLTLSTPPVI